MFEILIVDHIFFIIFGILFPLNAVFRSQPLMKSIEEWDTNIKLAFYRGNGLMLWGMALIIVITWLLTGRPLEILGLTWPDPGSWGLSLIISLLFMIAYGVDVWMETSTPEARAKTRKEWRENTPFLPENKKELNGFYWLALSAAVGEEVLFRGFFLVYLITLFGADMTGKFAALLVATLIFAFSHFYQGWRSVIKIAVLSLAFGVLFLVSGSLLLPVILHFIIDLIGGWLGFYLMKDAPGDF